MRAGRQGFRGLACALALVLALVLAHALPSHAARAASPWEPTRNVSRAELVAALRVEQRKGYALDAIANAVRLQAGVFFALAEQAAAADPEQRVLRIGHQDYRDAYLDVTRLAPQDVPMFVMVAHAFHEDYLVEYRRGRVIEGSNGANGPRRALNVKAGWPAGTDAPTRYSYEDRSTDPAVEVTHERVTAYRVLDYGTLIVYDDMRGVTGRATSGLLGSVFNVIGKAQAVQTRFAVAADGTQVSRTTASKLLTLSQTVTILPEGKVITGVPADRPDLSAIDQMLRRHVVGVAYLPLDMSAVPALGVPP